MSQEIIKKIENSKILPVVVLEDAANAVDLGLALIQGGLPIAEVTFRTSAALASIEALAKNCPDLLLGAGTVTKPEQVDQAVDAGANFIVSPGFNPAVVERALAKNILIVPGVNNPTAVEMATEFELDILKFFPAEASGGITMLKALAGPYGNIRFVPTGGVNQANISEYLALKNVIACGGSWMVDASLIKNRKFEEISSLSASAVAAVKNS